MTPCSSGIDDAETALITALGCDEKYEKRAIQLGNGHVINTLSFGSTQQNTHPIVVVHGWGAGCAFYGRNMAGLARQRRVHFVDLLGFGASSRPPFPMDGPPEKAEEFFISALEDWCDTMARIENAPAFHVVGHSLGAFLSVGLAQRAPKRVLSLTLASPVGVPRQASASARPPSSFMWRIVQCVVYRLWSLRVTPQWIMRCTGPWFGRMLCRRLMRSRFNVEPHVQELITEYFLQISRAKPSGEYALTAILKPGAWVHRPLVDRLTCIQCPTTFMYGDRDWMDPSEALRLAPEMKQATVCFVPNASHHIYFDNAEEFNRIVLDMTAPQ